MTARLDLIPEWPVTIAGSVLSLEHTFADDLDGLYVPWEPQGFEEPALLFYNRGLAEVLGLDVDAVEAQAATLFSGSSVPAEALPLSQAYAGHQFGGFSPQLGDGRAVLLGELVDPDGRRFDLQLKGSGPTPFSRGGDGQATLGPALREYLVGEAMHALGVSTTRALAVVGTGRTVMRRGPLPGAVLARVAASHLRVGTLQFFAVRRDVEKLTRLVDYALERHYADRPRSGNNAHDLLMAVAEAQAQLVASWMHVGFIHGVMNTDNVALSGETIDYGPCAFLDAYDPATVFSSIDHHGRYAYGNQPRIGQWNLARMAEALLPLLADDQDAAVARGEEALVHYTKTYDAAWLGGMRRKLGLRGEQDDDLALVSDLLTHLREHGHDFTKAFRDLSSVASAAWRERWRARRGDADPAAVDAARAAVNPVYIPRNHLVEEALEAAIAGDLEPFRTLMSVLERPFEVQPGRERYAEPAPAEFGPYTTFCGT